MLRAYFDAGFKSKPRRVFYVAGYVGFPNDWLRFNRKWRELLRRNNLPYFHMTDFVARTGFYKGWPEERRLAVMKRIVTLGSNAVRLGVAATLLPDDYERLSESDRKLIPNPYGLCLSACIAKTARLLQRQGVTDPVAYVFESGDPGQGTTKLALEELLANPAKRKAYAFHSLTYADKAEAMGLQLADVFAFETGRYVPHALGWESSEVRKSFQALQAGNSHYAMLFDFEELSKIAAKRRASSLPLRPARVHGIGKAPIEGPHTGPVE